MCLLLFENYKIVNKFFFEIVAKQITIAFLCSSTPKFHTFQTQPEQNFAFLFNYCSFRRTEVPYGEPQLLCDMCKLAMPF